MCVHTPNFSLYKNFIFYVGKMKVQIYICHQVSFSSQGNKRERASKRASERERERERVREGVGLGWVGNRTLPLLVM